MLTSPVLRYELLTLGRRRRYYLLRGVYVIGLLFALWLCYVEAFGWYGGYSSRPLLTAYSYLAEYFFAAFAGIQLGAILLLTPATVAGTIAGEHERRTIDYLLTTHLTDGEITLCKFAARMLSLVYQLLVGLPVLALVMLFGGIEPRTLIEVFGYSSLVLLGTASLSLWISASCRHTRVAITSAYLVVIVLVGLPLLCLLALEEWRFHRHLPVLAEAIWAWNVWGPVMLIVGAFDDGLPTVVMKWHRPEYIVPLYLTASVVWLGLAVRALRRTYAKAGVVAARGWWPWSKREKPPRTVGRHAMLWKELVGQRSVLRLGWIGRAATVILFSAAYIALGLSIYFTVEQENREYPSYSYYYYDQNRDPFGYAVPFQHTPLHQMSCGLNAIVGTFVLLLIASRSAGAATSEKEQDTWLTLLSTPLTAFEVVSAKIAGALYSVRYWYLFLILVWICGSVRFPYLLAILPLLFAVHLLLGWLCAAVGLFFSLRFSSSLWSIGATVGLLAIVFGAAPLLLMFMIDQSMSRGGDNPELMFIGFVAPVTFFGPELIFVQWLCRSSGLRDDDQQVAVSITAAVALSSITALALTADLVRRFAILTGRLDNDISRDEPVSEDPEKPEPANEVLTETATEAAS